MRKIRAQVVDAEGSVNRRCWGEDGYAGANYPQDHVPIPTLTIVSVVQRQDSISRGEGRQTAKFSAPPDLDDISPGIVKGFMKLVG
jgi:hypothetical protein